MPMQRRKPGLGAKIAEEGDDCSQLKTLHPMTLNPTVFRLSGRSFPSMWGQSPGIARLYRIAAADQPVFAAAE